MRIGLALMLIVNIVFGATVFAADDVSKTLTPELIRENYKVIESQWPKVPRNILLAFAAAEDSSFFEKAPGQASSVTQYVGRLYLQSRTEKILQIATIFMLSETLSHDEILNWFVNQVYLGQNCYGISAAATAYFGKPIEDLSLEEIAYLAGLPKAPTAFHPIRSLDRAIWRRNSVLSEMLKAGLVSKGEAAEAANSRLIVREPLGRCTALD